MSTKKKIEFTGERIEIKTSRGVIIAQIVDDDDYPGIAIDFIPKGRVYEIPMILAEFDLQDKDHTGARVLVWGNQKQEDYTEEFIFEKEVK
jgi:hypothetical protein